MTAPAVATVAESATTSGSTSHTITMPASIAAGETLLILHGLSAARNDSAPGWTEIGAGGATADHWFWREADGTEGADETFTTDGVGVKSASLCWRITGAADPSTSPPEISTVATATDTAPDATTCTPTGGPKDFLYITGFRQAGEEADDDTWVSATPTGYANTLQKATGVTGAASTNCQVAGAEKGTTGSSSDDAGAFTTAQSRLWTASTVGIHPSAAVGITMSVGHVNIGF